jgi:hypothetical protein
MAPTSRWDWHERLEAVLPIARYLEWGESLRWMHAASLAFTTKRHAEGMVLLQEIVGSPVKQHVRDFAIDQLELFDAPRRIEKRHCDSAR